MTAPHDVFNCYVLPSRISRQLLGSFVEVFRALVSCTCVSDRRRSKNRGTWGASRNLGLSVRPEGQWRFDRRVCQVCEHARRNRESHERHRITSKLVVLLGYEAGRPPGIRGGKTDYENRERCYGTDWQHAAGAAEQGDRRLRCGSCGETGEPESRRQREGSHWREHDCRGRARGENTSW